MGSYPSVVDSNVGNNDGAQDQTFLRVQCAGRWYKVITPYSIRRVEASQCTTNGHPISQVTEEEWYDVPITSEQGQPISDTQERRNALSPNDFSYQNLHQRKNYEVQSQPSPKPAPMEVDSEESLQLENSFASDDQWNMMNLYDPEADLFPVHRVDKEELMSEEPFPHHSFTPETQARLRRRSAQGRLTLLPRKNLAQLPTKRRRIQRLALPASSLSPIIEETCQPCTPRRGRNIFPASRSEMTRVAPIDEEVDDEDDEDFEDDHPFSPVTQASLAYTSAVRSQQKRVPVPTPGPIHTQTYQQRDLTKPKIRSKRRKMYWSMQPGVSPIAEQWEETPSIHISPATPIGSGAQSPDRDEYCTRYCSRRLDFSDETPETPETPPSSPDSPTRNAFINFAQQYHRQGRNVVESIREASDDWQRLSAADRSKLSHEAGKVRKVYRSKNKRLNSLIKILNSMKSFDEQGINKFRSSLDRWINNTTPLED